MVDIQHESLPDSRLHECKGAASATVGQVLTAVGDGTATFQNPALLPREFITEDALSSSSFTAQTVASTGDEKQIVYGAPAASPGNTMSIDASGNIIFNIAGTYHLTGFVSAGRSTNTGVTELAFSLRYNGTQVGATEIAKIDDNSQSLSVLSGSGIFTVAAGDIISLHMLMVDDAGGVAGVYPTTVPNTGWSDSPSTRIAISKLGVA